jgi:phosphodiesterase/alkaline phosphatase D-like protein
MASPSGSGATVTWNTAAASDSQVEYGTSNAYGTTTPLAATAVTAHTVAISGLTAGTTYHYRARSRDSDAVLAIGVDHTLTTPAAVLVAVTPATASIASGASLQLMALVSRE